MTTVVEGDSLVATPEPVSVGGVVSLGRETTEFWRERLRGVRLGRMAMGIAAPVGVVTGASLALPSWQLLGLVTLWLAAHLRVARCFEDRPVGTALRGFVVVLVGAAAAAGALGVERPVLAEWSVVIGAATLALIVVLALGGMVRGTRRVMVVGDEESVRRTTARWGERSKVVLVDVVVVDEEPSAALVEEIALGVERSRADVVLCVGDSLDESALRALGWRLEDEPVRIAVSSSLGSAAPARVHAARVADRTVVMLAPSRPSPVVSAVKAVVDRAVAALVVVALIPLLVGLVIAIRLDSRGPALFHQVRVGKGGRFFTMFKFRTMGVDAEARRSDLSPLDDGNEVLFKIHEDPRVTRVGRVLRRTSLDELPQLLNVLRGEMSLVGPRPALPEEVEAYDDVAGRRLAVKPGMTGLWQVMGRSDLDWEQSIALDVDYVDNVSLPRDLAICLSTVQAVTSGRGAY